MIPVRAERWRENALVRRLLRHKRWRQIFGAVAPRYLIVRVGPLEMMLDLKDKGGVSKYILRYGTYAPGVSRIMRETIGPDGNVIDVGANIGYHALYAGTLTRGRVVAFEPEPHNFAMLSENIALNDAGNVEVRFEACGEAPARLKLHLNPANAGDHRLWLSDESQRDTIEVNVVRVDDALPGITNVHFIKIDVQGYETPVLRGLEKTLGNNPKAVVVSEFWPAGLAAAGSSADACLDFMESLGFRWTVIDDLHDRVAAMDRAAVYAKCGPNGFVDLLFRR